MFYFKNKSKDALPQIPDTLSKPARKLYSRICDAKRFYPAYHTTPGRYMQELLDAGLIVDQERVKHTQVCFVPTGTSDFIRDKFPPCGDNDDERPFLVLQENDFFHIEAARILMILAAHRVVQLEPVPGHDNYMLHLLLPERVFPGTIHFTGLQNIEFLYNLWQQDSELGPITFGSIITKIKPAQPWYNSIKRLVDLGRAWNDGKDYSTFELIFDSSFDDRMLKDNPQPTGPIAVGPNARRKTFDIDNIRREPPRKIRRMKEMLKISTTILFLGIALLAYWMSQHVDYLSAFFTTRMPQ